MAKWQGLPRWVDAGSPPTTGMATSCSSSARPHDRICSPLATALTAKANIRMSGGIARGKKSCSAHACWETQMSALPRFRRPGRTRSPRTTTACEPSAISTGRYPATQGTLFCRGTADPIASRVTPCAPAPVCEAEVDAAPPHFYSILMAGQEVRFFASR